VNKSALAILLVGLLAAAAGLGAGWFLRGGTPAPVQPPPVHAPEGVTREQLELLRQELLAELGRIGRAQAAGGTPPATVDNSVNELGRRIDELDARIAVLATGVRPGIGGRAWVNARGQGSESIERMIARIGENDARRRKGEPNEDMVEALTREHYLWTLEDVVRAYGPPEHLETSSGLALFYGSFRLDGTEKPCAVCIRIVEGFVTDVDYDCSHHW